MNRIIAIIAATVLAIGLGASAATAQDGWDRQGPPAGLNRTLDEQPTEYPGVFAYAQYPDGPRELPVVVAGWWSEDGATTERAKYRIVKTGKLGRAYQTVARGHVSDHDWDLVNVRFPKAKTTRHVQVRVGGDVILDKKVRMR